LSLFRRPYYTSLYFREKEIDSSKLQEEIDIVKAKLTNLKVQIPIDLIWPLVIVAIGLFCSLSRHFINYKNETTYNLVNYGGIIVLGIGVVFMVYILYGRLTYQGSLKYFLDYYQSKKRIIDNLYSLPIVPNLAQPTTKSYFDSLVNINVDNLAEYYRMVKLHTDKSFQVSIIVGLIGFSMIIIGLVSGFIGAKDTKTISYISAGAGVVTEFIAGVFFYLYNKTVSQLKEYHDSLLAVQNILLSFKIVGDINTETEKVKMMDKMLEFLMSKQPKIPV
jgi:hypothetical protein